MDVHLANPRGFCAGVERAIEIVERSLEMFGAPVYVRHEIVHNHLVVEQLVEKGAVFVDELDEVPDNATVIFSAHGVSLEVRREGARRGLNVLDATCPLVSKIHHEVASYCKAGKDVILIGHPEHAEVIGTLGQWREQVANGNRIYSVQSLADIEALEVGNPDAVAYVTQTTLSMDDTRDLIASLKEKFPSITGPRNEDICYATQNRQNAIKSLVDRVDVVLVVGSATSSNSNRLRETAEDKGVRAYLIDNAEEIDPRWMENTRNVGVTAGASAPESSVVEVIERLRQIGATNVREFGNADESMQFALPRALRETTIT